MKLTDKQAALKEMVYQLRLMQLETELKIVANEDAMDSLSEEGGIPRSVVDRSTRRYLDRIHTLEEELSTHDENLETVYRELAGL